MKNRIRLKWDLFRIARLFIGLFILGYGIFSSLWIFALFGLIFTLMPLLNIGCPGNSGCSSSEITKSKEKKEEELIYEEIEFKKEI